MNARWFIGGACLFALAVGVGPTGAEVTGVVTDRSVTVQDIYNGFNFAQQVGNEARQFGFPNGSYRDFQTIENYQVSANVLPDEIDFANNVSAHGFYANVTATTTVKVTYRNDGTTAVVPTLKSSILPGGFGFFMADAGANPTLGNGGRLGDINQSPQSGVATFTNAGAFLNGGPSGQASFSFSILSDGATVKSFTGGVSLYETCDAVCLSSSVQYQVVADPAPALNGFGLVTPAGSDQAVGYAWDETTIDVPLGITLQPGESATLTYVSSVHAFSGLQNFFNPGNPSPNCLEQYVCAQLLAYSGFGDPIGRGTGGSAGVITPFTDPGTIMGVNFPVFRLGLPTFNDVTGGVDSPVLPGTLPQLPLQHYSGAPEPESWVLMLVGVGLAGAILRRRVVRA